MQLFRDRSDAGRQLAQALRFIRNTKGLVILGIPRGGVTVAHEVSLALNAPLDVWIAHKISAPENPEFAIGAISMGGTTLLNQDVLQYLGITTAYLDGEIIRQKEEIRRRLELYREKLPPHELQGKTVVLVDDGLATGATVEVSLRDLRSIGVKQLILAAPVASTQALTKIETESDMQVILTATADFQAVGQYYEDFPQVSDEEVIDLLKQNRQSNPG